MDPHELTLALVLGKEIIDIKHKDGVYTAVVLKNGVWVRSVTREGKAVLEVIIPNDEE